MKNKTYFLLTIIIIIIDYNVISAQWFLVDPPPTSYNLNCIQLASQLVGYAAGGNGTILKTTDGGKTWKSQKSGTNKNLYGISFINEYTGTVVGESGTILRTTDGGISWIVQLSDTHSWLYCVSFIDVNNGIIVGMSDQFPPNLGIILRTTDGGTNWFPQIFWYGPLTAISYTDYNNAITSGYFLNTKIFKSIDGGQSWVDIDSLNSMYLNQFNFSNNGNGIAVGWYYNQFNNYGIIMKTTDNGQNWNQLLKLNEPDITFRSLSFADTNTGTIVGDKGIILRTINGGSNWSEQSGGTDKNLMSVSFSGPNVGIAVGDEGTIIITSNGGITDINSDKTDKELRKYYLFQNYPNPFNPATELNYTIPIQSKVTIKIYDVLGSEVETLVNEIKPAGTYRATWNAANRTSGVYFYQLRAGDFIQTKKMILLR